MSKDNLATPKGLSRADVAEKLQAARAAGKTPNLSGMRMWGNYSGLDFTSEFESKYGPHTSEILDADFRNAILRGCNFNRSDLASANLRGRISATLIYRVPIFTQRSWRMPTSRT